MFDAGYWACSRLFLCHQFNDPFLHQRSQVPCALKYFYKKQIHHYDVDQGRFCMAFPTHSSRSFRFDPCFYDKIS